jgi:hypothetical protein
LSTKIEDLAEPFRTKAKAFYEAVSQDPRLKDLGAAGFIVLETRRKIETQAAYFARLLASCAPAKYRKQAVLFVQAVYKMAGLYEIPAIEALKPVTWTMQSRHLEDLALDIWPSKDGKRIWWAPPSWAGWARMAEIAKDHGIEAGYTWAGDEQDPPHFQEARN